MEVDFRTIRPFIRNHSYLKIYSKKSQFYPKPRNGEEGNVQKNALHLSPIKHVAGNYIAGMWGKTDRSGGNVLCSPTEVGESRRSGGCRMVEEAK